MNTFAAKTTICALCPELKIGIFSAGLKSRDNSEAVIVAGIQSSV